ncbi:MAG: hypothetical protein HYV41_04740 [Candidatus Magasanikbacteria bacterium]|nr:hypothetical protein [Candidatus Magasanikbacteria bacterium]
MPIPTQTQLEQQKKETQEKIRRLKQTYDDFLYEWGKIEREEREIVTELRSHIDKTKIHSVLSVIHSIKE